MQPQWLSRTREAALARFAGLGFPTTRLEEWRYTPVGPISEKYFAPPADGMTQADEDLRSALAPGAALAVSVNGKFAPHLSALGKLPKGVQVLSLEAALASNPALVEPYLAKLAPSEQQPFTALN